MEWPKHYTSEKVLVLMTYTEMMNRKYGREMTSQIKPVRYLNEQKHRFGGIVVIKGNFNTCVMNNIFYSK